MPSYQIAKPTARSVDAGHQVVRLGVGQLLAVRLLELVEELRTDPGEHRRGHLVPADDRRQRQDLGQVVGAAGPDLDAGRYGGAPGVGEAEVEHGVGLLVAEPEVDERVVPGPVGRAHHRGVGAVAGSEPGAGLRGVRLAERGRVADQPEHRCGQRTATRPAQPAGHHGAVTAQDGALEAVEQRPDGCGVTGHRAEQVVGPPVTGVLGGGQRGDLVEVGGVDRRGSGSGRGGGRRHAGTLGPAALQPAWRFPGHRRPAQTPTGGPSREGPPVGALRCCGAAVLRWD